MKKLLWSVVGVAAIAGVAQGQAYYTGFELPDINGSASGTALAGQQGWYTPAVTGTMGANVHTYAGNTPGFVQNPVGGNQFAVTASQGGTAFSRGQHDYPFAAAQYTVAYDYAGVFTGTVPSAANLSSFSLNHATLTAGQFRGFIALNNFVNLNDPSAGIKTEFNVFNAAGTATNNLSPGPAWADLDTNHWYRQYISFDLVSNLITSITLVDLHTGVSNTATPTGWYLDGGAQSTLPFAGAVRMFGGGPAGNTTGWDNIQIVPAPGALALLAGAGLFGARRRRA